MCFSETASLSAGIGLSALGVTSVALARSQKKLIPFALIPFFFGVQQLFEAGVWHQIEAGLDPRFFVYGFIFFALPFWPAYLAFSVWMQEEPSWRRHLMLILELLGLVVAGILIWRLGARDLSVAVENQSLQYALGHSNFEFAWKHLLYIFPTCLPTLLSKKRAIQIFGLFITAGLLISLYAYSETYISVWCFFAAVSSLIILWQSYRVSRASKK